MSRETLRIILLSHFAVILPNIRLVLRVEVYPEQYLTYIMVQSRQRIEDKDMNP